MFQKTAITIKKKSYSVGKGSELSVDEETSAVETTDVLLYSFTFSSAVQAVNVPVVNIKVNTIAILFFILSPSFQATLYPQDCKCPGYFAIIKIKEFKLNCVV